MRLSHAEVVVPGNGGTRISTFVVFDRYMQYQTFFSTILCVTINILSRLLENIQSYRQTMSTMSNYTLLL